MHRAAQAGAAGVVGAARHVTAVPDSELATFSTLLTTSHIWSMELMTMADHQGVLLRLHHLVVQPVRQTFHIWSIGHRGGSRRRTPFVLPLRRQLRRGGVSGAAGAQSRSEPEAADTATPGAGRRVYITFRDTAKGSDARLNSVAHEQCSLAPTPSRHSAHRVHACAGRSSPHASSAGTRTWAAGMAPPACSSYCPCPTLPSS